MEAGEGMREAGGRRKATLGRPMKLQKEWVRMQGRREPVRRKRKAGGKGGRGGKTGEVSIREEGEKTMRQAQTSPFPSSLPSFRPHSFLTCLPAEDAGVGDLQRHFEQGLLGLCSERVEGGVGGKERCQ